MKIADAFNEYFTSINATTVLPDHENLATLQSELDILLQDFINSHMPPSSQDKFFIPLITKEIVEADLSKIPSNKATGLDGISVRVLKEALPAISLSLALIYNVSISIGVFPAAFKIAKVLPLHKRDSIRERGNYRPKSVLPILSKPVETDIASAYLQHLTSNNLLYSDQSAYRPFHPCETALLNISDNWLKAMDNSELVGTVFLDLSKAFDLVNHDILLAKLDKYHTGTNTMDWFRSYLTGCIQVVSVSGALSSPLNLDVGVPQGSILGPPLFSIYINDLPLLLKDTEVDVYADDITIWSNGTNCTDIQNTLNDSLDKANSWFKLKRMIPNTKKTKHLLVGSVQKLNHSSETTMEIYMDNIKLEEAAGEKLLGVVIDSNFSWKLRIDYLIKKSNSRIYLLQRAKAYLTFACRKMLYNALIKPILEYCCTVRGNCTVDNLQRVLRLQKRCARLILDAGTHENSVKLFKIKIGCLQTILYVSGSFVCFIK